MLVNPNMRFDADGWGLMFLLIAIFSAVAYGLVLNKLAANIHPVLLIAIQNTIGALYFLPLCLLWGEKLEIMTVEDIALLSNLPPEFAFWLCILLLSVFSSSLAFIFYSFSVKQIGITRSNVFTNLIPVFTAITSYILLGERLTWLKIAGIFIIILGLMLVQKKRKQKEFSKYN